MLLCGGRNWISIFTWAISWSKLEKLGAKTTEQKKVSGTVPLSKSVENIQKVTINYALSPNSNRDPYGSIERNRQEENWGAGAIQPKNFIRQECVLRIVRLDRPGRWLSSGPVFLSDYHIAWPMTLSMVSATTKAHPLGGVGIGCPGESLRSSSPRC